MYTPFANQQSKIITEFFLLSYGYFYQLGIFLESKRKGFIILPLLGFDLEMIYLTQHIL